MAQLSCILLLLVSLIGVNCMMVPKMELMTQTESVTVPMFAHVVDAALNTEVLATLAKAVVAADLADTLADPVLEATVFAPTDTAFNETLGELQITLEDLFSNITILKDILTYHVVPIVASSAQLEEDMTLPTLSGNELGVVVQDEGVTILGVGSEASVILPDVTAGLAVVHVIDSVLLP